MCKTKKAFFIDSNNRNADSASGIDLTIDSNHQLTVPDGSGIAVDSLNLPSKTTAPHRVRILGIVLKVLTISDSGNDLSTFATDLQGLLNTNFPVNAAIHNVPPQWQQDF